MVEVFCMTLEVALLAASTLAAQQGGKVLPLGTVGYMVVDSKGVVLAHFRIIKGNGNGNGKIKKGG